MASYGTGTARPLTRVLFIATGLRTGGAEKMLAKVLSCLHGVSIDASVVSLLGRGPISAEIETLGVPVRHLELEASWRLPLSVAELARAVRSFKPDVIQGWMYHGNLAALMGRGCALGQPKLIWGIRQSLYDVKREKLGTRLAIRLGAWLSGRADAIVYNSETARQQHEAFGYAASRSLVVDNGFETGRFHPDPGAYRAVREELGIAPETKIIGLIARYHPMKGHVVFLQAAAMLAERVPHVHFLLVGKDVVTDNPSLAPWLITRALDGRVHLLGERRDILRLTPALDIASSSSSWGEGFSNALGEAMSCAVPCVATDVGDVRRILGDAGIVVSMGDAGALAGAWEKVLAMSEDMRSAMGKGARSRVIEHFSLHRIAALYAALYRDKSCEMITT